MDATRIAKNWGIKMEFKKFMESLKGNQHKLDKNKNGKLDAHDFKLLRQEEDECEYEDENEKKEMEEAADRVARADYKTTPSGRKTHKEIVFKDGSSDVKEETELDERTMTDAEMSKREKIVKGMKKNVAGFKAKYGERAKSVMYATATKMAMKEESELDEAKDTVVKDKSGKVVSWKHEGDWKKTGEKKDPRGKVTHMSDVARRQTEKMTKEEVELDEAFINGREYASQGVMHPDHAKLHKAGDTRDFYAHGSGDKLSGKVTKNDGKEVHIQADKSSGGKLHKFKVTPHLPKPVNEEAESLDEISKATLSSYVKKSSSKQFTAGHKAATADSGAEKKAIDKAQKRSQGVAKAVDRLTREELEFDILDEAVESGNKGYGYHGQHSSETADKEYAKAHSTVKKVAGAAGHLRDAKKPNVMVKHYLDSRHGRHLADVGTHDHEYIKKDFGKFKKSYKESDFTKESVGFDDEGNLMEQTKLSLLEFLQLNEIEFVNGRYVHKGTYGSSYQGDDDDEDDDKPKKPAAPAVKRGRGRPAGSKSGANQKVTSGKSYGGIAHHTLNLPNTTK